MLRPADIAEVERRGHRWRSIDGNGETHFIVTDFALPTGLEPEQADVLVRVPSLFPVVSPDMFWAAPPIQRRDRSAIPATQITEILVGCRWQRWSRHLQPSQWRPDQDDLGSYLDIVSQCLRVAAV